jgi:hypothetical protein
MIQTLFSNSDTISKKTVPHSHSWNYSIMVLRDEGELQHPPWPAQSPGFSIIEPLWLVLETRVRSRFPHPTSLKQFEDVLQEEWYKIPLHTVRNLDESIPRTAVVLKAKGGPAPY